MFDDSARDGTHRRDYGHRRVGLATRWVGATATVLTAGFAVLFAQGTSAVADPTPPPGPSSAQRTGVPDPAAGGHPPTTASPPPTTDPVPAESSTTRPPTRQPQPPTRAPRSAAGGAPHAGSGGS